MSGCAGHAVQKKAGMPQKSRHGLIDAGAKHNECHIQSIKNRRCRFHLLNGNILKSRQKKMKRPESLPASARSFHTGAYSFPGNFR